MIKGIDLYTKTILTVIAVCLIYIITKDINIIPEAQAQYGSTDIKSCVEDIQSTVNDIQAAIGISSRGYSRRSPLKSAVDSIQSDVDSIQSTVQDIKRNMVMYLLLIFSKKENTSM